MNNVANLKRSVAVVLNGRWQKNNNKYAYIALIKKEVNPDSLRTVLNKKPRNCWDGLPYCSDSLKFSTDAGS